MATNKKRPRRPVDSLPLRLRMIRHDLGLREGKGSPVSAEVVADKIGVSAQAWTFWERGVSRPAREELTLRHLAEVLGYEPEWVLHGGELEPES